MAKRRTKKQKIQAKSRRQRHAVAVTSSSKRSRSIKKSSSQGMSSSVQNKKAQAEDILTVPAKYIYADITKTVMLSVFFLGVIFALWYALEIQGLQIFGI